MEAKKESTSLPEFLRNFRQLISPYQRMSWQTIGLSLLVQVLAFGEPTVMMIVTNQVVRNLIRHEWKVMANLPFYFIAGCSTLLVLHLLKLAQRRIGRRLTIALERDVYLGSLRKLLTVPLRYHLQHNTGESVGMLTRGLSRVVELVWHINYDFLPALCLMTVTISVLFWVDARTAGIIFAATAIYSILLTRVTRETRPLNLQRNDLWKNADERVGQAVTCVMTVQASSQESREMAVVEDLVDHGHRLFFEEFRMLDRTSLQRNSMTIFVRVGVQFLCVVSALRGQMSVGVMSFTMLAVERAFNHLYELAGIYEKLLDCVEPVQRIMNLRKEPVAFADADVGVRLGKAKGRITFDGVGYAYAADGTANGSPKGFALRDLSLQIEAGEMVGVAGESGHGKSTFAKLLLRFMDPDEGTIQLDGVDIRAFVLADYRRNIGYVPQEVEIFNASIADNIRYAAPDATEAEVIHAAKIAGAHDFIHSLELGYGTLVGNRGLRLSGGQRQRIGIARAVMTRPSILVFDEATNSLDAVSIRKILNAITEELRGTCTIIVISHQLSTIQHADRIVVVENGRLSEIGTHEQLSRQNGLYHKLVRIQQQTEATL